MNITIDKIENGFIVSIDGRKTFCSEAMGICGLLAEWAQATVERLEKGQTYEDMGAMIAKIQAQMMAAPKVKPLDFSDDFEDAYKYMASPQVQATKIIESDPTILEKLKDRVLGNKK